MVQHGTSNITLLSFRLAMKPKLWPLPCNTGLGLDFMASASRPKFWPRPHNTGLSLHPGLDLLAFTSRPNFWPWWQYFSLSRGQNVETKDNVTRPRPRCQIVASARHFSFRLRPIFGHWGRDQNFTYCTLLLAFTSTSHQIHLLPSSEMTIYSGCGQSPGATGGAWWKISTSD